MTREDMTPEAYGALLDSITDILLKNGLKATTMDSIATSLKKSKRTLYEIFSSKSNMVSEALRTLHQQLSDANKSIIENSSNSMEAILNGFLHHRDVMRKANVNFFRDMDIHYASARQTCNNSKEAYLNNFVSVLNRGVEQGLFRNDINFRIHCKMMAIQMESLKRMEELFPPDITLLEAYDSICFSFLRGISTPKGMEMLDKLIDRINK